MLLNEIFGYEIKRKPSRQKRREQVLTFIRHMQSENQNKEYGKHSTAYDITREIFTSGDCGRMFKILQQVFPEALAFWDNQQSHVVTEINGELFDITGSLGTREDYPTPLKKISKTELEDTYCRYSFDSRGPSW